MNREAEALAQDIERRVRQSGTSFYWAMRLMPQQRRNGIYAVYAFCREVDDIADGDKVLPTPGPQGKQDALQVWRGHIDDLYAGRQPADSLARCLAEPIRQWDLQRDDFLAVIDGCAMDAEGPIRRPPMAVLDLYCDRVASAVGRLCLPIFGETSPDRNQVAYHLGRALQLTNILRDVAEDAERGRLYLPDELLSAQGITSSDPAAVATHPALPRVCAELAKVASGHYAEAQACIGRGSRRALRPATLMGAIYRNILERLEQQHFAGPRVHVPTAVKLWLALRCSFL